MNEVLRSVLLRALIIFGLLVSGVLVYAVTAPFEIHQPLSDMTVVDLQPDVETGQSFIANYSGLNRISLQAERVPDGSLEELKFRLLVGTPGDERPLLDENDASFELTRGWIHIRFPPQPYETPQRVVFHLDARSSEAISLRAHSENMYPQGIRLNSFGDLTFEAGFRPSAEQTIGLMISRLTSHKLGHAGVGWFYVLLLASMLVAQVMFLEIVLFTQESKQVDCEAEVDEVELGR